MNSRGDMLAIRLFGRPQFSVDGVAREFAASRKTIPLLAYLLTHQGAPIAREYLASLLWPDDTEDAARTNLRRHLHLLVKALPAPPADAPYVLNTQHTTRWNPRAPAVADVPEFIKACASGTDLDRAAGLYTGPFLEEFYDEWIVAERERLLETQLDILRKLVRRKRGERDLEGALADVTRILTLDPWREDAIRMELALRDSLGDRSGALATYRAFAQRLRADLDTEPMPETFAAYQSLLLAGDTPRKGAREPASTDSSHGSERLRSLPFHGRDEALASLKRAWTAAASGRGSVTLVGGEAGIGKSRLVAELSLFAESQGARVFAGATPPQESVSHEAVADCLRSAATLLAKCSIAPETTAVLGRIVPAFAPPSATLAARTAPESERFALFEAVAEAFGELARNRPLLIVLEDVHWAGTDTLALLEFLAARLAGRAVALVATYRAEEVDRAHPLRALRKKLEREPAFSHVSLARLDRAAVATIAGEVRHESGDALERTVDALLADSEGVPLFLEAALRDGAGGAAGYDRLRLDARIARLNPEALAVLEVASVIGAGFDVEVVREVLGWGEADVLAAIDRLIAAYLVREPQRLRRNDFTFAHHLVREAVYALIDERTRIRRHAAVGLVLAELNANGFDDVAAIVARHYEIAGKAADAADAYGRAARRSAALYANEEARSFAHKALANASDTALRCEMLLLAEHASGRLADRDLQDRDLAELETLAPGTPYAAAYFFARARLTLARGKFDDAAAFLERARAALEPGDARSRGTARAIEAQIFAERGAFAEARAAMEEALAASERADDDEQTLDALRNVIAMSLDTLDLTTAYAFSQRLLERAERARHVERQAYAHDKLGVVLSRQGQMDEALEHFEAARVRHARVGNTIEGTLVGYNIAVVQLLRGRFDIARAVFEEAVERLRDFQNANHLATAYANLCALQLLMGDVAEARIAMERGLDANGDARSGTYAQLQISAAMVFRLLGNSAESLRRITLGLEAIRPYGASEPLAEALLTRMLLEMEANDAVRARATKAEILALPAEIPRDAFSPELYPWFYGDLARLEGDAAAADAFHREAAARFHVHLERLTPEGREQYLRVPWIEPLARYSGVGRLADAP